MTQETPPPDLFAGPAPDPGPPRRHRRWDGVSTYSQADGAIDVGWHGDGTPRRWQLPAGGTLAGGVATGKTTTAHVIAGEAGTAEVCATCTADHRAVGTCAWCDMRRVCAVIMCDPVMASFAGWRGYADLTAWGTAATVHALRMLAAAATRRAAAYSAAGGDGGFTPTPAVPLLLAVVDDWGALACSPAGAAAAACAETISRYPGAGVAVVRTQYDPGTPRRDGQAVVLTGHPDWTGHPPGWAGGEFTVKNLPVDAADGASVRTVGLRMAVTPVIIDPPAAVAFAQHGFLARRQVLDAAATAVLRRT